jgi:uncharacterized membrane protein YjgN (DUF898 family)
MDEHGTRAFGFSGTWREYAPIAFTNLLLTIVTLGFYRFWATTRTRRYLWSRTRFIDETLEWTGTGLELFIGFLLVLVLFGIPFVFLQFGAQALIFQGYGILAGCLTIAAFFLIFYLAGVARFRMLRYRLSRTHWHGIRGGSDDRGWGYGWSYIWKNFVGSLAAGLMIPWSMMSLWNERWNGMSFGPHRFEAAGDHGPTFKRFLLFYAIPLVLVIGGGIFATMFARQVAGDVEPLGAGSVILLSLLPLAVYGFLGFAALAFYSSFYREAIEGLSFSTLYFHFNARSKDWFKLILGDVGLVIVTLGIGSIFLGYRHWKFFITHLDATGEISLSELTQSTTAAPGQGEGLADAFDVGAI